MTGIRSIATSSTKNCLANAVSQHLGLGDSITKKYSAVADHLRQTTGISDSEYGVFDQYTVDHRGDVDFQSALDAAFAQEANVIQRMFFKSYHKSLDKDKADRLLKHQ